MEDYDEVMKIIVRSAMELTDADLAELDLFENENRVRNYLINKIPKEKQEKKVVVEMYEPDDFFDGGIIKHVVETNRPYVTGFTDEDPFYKGVSYIKSEVALPLSRKGRFPRCAEH